MMKKLLLVAVPAVLFSTQLQAGCKTSDLQGNWVFYQAGMSQMEGFHTGRCDVTFTNKGRDSSADCEMNMMDGSVMNFKMTGTAVIDPTFCRFTIEFAFTGGTATWDAQLNKNKNSFSGDWKNSWGTIGTTNGVKR
ncbi:MAG: hypothetical protein PHT19_00235 [Methylococcus sp.]|nr:hypothetical protein [Methylococcus sp.]